MDNERTGQGLIDFLDWALEKNELVPSTASALRTGCLKVLSATDDWENSEVSPENVDDYLQRFRNKNKNELKQRTLDAYARRFQQSVEMHHRRLAGDTDWKPRERASRRKPAQSPRTQAPAANREVQPARRAVAATLEPTVTNPFPLRPNLLVELKLPRDLASDEAARIATFVASLAIPTE